ncbi:MAG TPA: hypothetical protein VGO73_13635 [Pyrinomonadaceae bacterium]|jgi:hypothetical protein|nr:hypothetical protein [Pyrinomonadaceae bacterium]
MSEETRKQKIGEWKWGVLAAAAMMLLALWPQLNMWIARGANWQGSYVSVQVDEVAYSAYINALVDGRPRRNDPYSGRDDRPNQPQPESLFSIQFVPAYAIALPARALGITATTAFIALIVIVAFLSTLAIFWLLKTIGGDARLAATGALVVLCLGMMVASQGEARVLLGLPILADDFFPFLRRYQPSVTFPLLFMMCVAVWYALRSETRRSIVGWSMTAGFMLALLIFSYFYLWTAAAAWLACLGIVWLAARPEEWRRVAFVFGVVGAFALAALVPYAILLSHRASETDTSILMIPTHAPDLFRVPELLSAAVLAVLAIQARRGKIDWKAPQVLFTASLALMSFAVFNQQLLTGRSLQPIHYQIFVANYVALLAIVLTVAILVAGRDGTKRIPGRVLALVSMAVFGWGIIETTGGTNRNVAQARLRDDATPVVKWMAEEGKKNGFNGASGDTANPRAVIFTSALAVADSLPTGAPQAQLFVGHMEYYSGVSPAELKERFFQSMYYSGFTEQDLAEAMSEGRFTIMAALFGIGRAIPALSNNQKPITLEEARAELSRYSEYINSFTRERASHPTLSYVVVPTQASSNFSNLDRWYERGPGEQAGLFTIYRVKLKQ